MRIYSSSTTDAQALPGLIKQTDRKIREASADGAYDTRCCHDALLKKNIRPLIPARRGAKCWPDQYHERNQAVAEQNMSGSNDDWKKKGGYHRRSVAETAVSRLKKLLGGHLSLRNYQAQAGEAMAMVKALNQMTLLRMPDSIRIASSSPLRGQSCWYSYLFNKASIMIFYFAKYLIFRSNKIFYRICCLWL